MNEDIKIMIGSYIISVVESSKKITENSDTKNLSMNY
jgi:hypothetical protein